MSIKTDDVVTIFSTPTTYEAPITRVDEDSEVFLVTLKAGGRMAFNFPNPFGNCEGVGHKLTAKVKG